jgi:hypothetical protein
MAKGVEPGFEALALIAAVVFVESPSFCVVVQVHWMLYPWLYVPSPSYVMIQTRTAEIPAGFFSGNNPSNRNQIFRIRFPEMTQFLAPEPSS